ncbi:MAG: nucleoside hydrolase [bacterium]|nr:nucleoside hydrolase [bacterium]
MYIDSRKIIMLLVLILGILAFEAKEYWADKKRGNKRKEDDKELHNSPERPKGKVDVVIDTDTFNEIDDQYALAYLIKSEDKLDLKAIYAAPFLNSKVKSAKEGMEKSRDEILNILSLMKRDDLKSMVYSGSENFMKDEQTPIISDAAKDLAERAMSYTKENPLYVIGIAAITDVSSALLINPEIKDRIVVVWLGGHGQDYKDTAEFNMKQDIAAARILFGCGVRLVQLPCKGVVSSFTTTGPELEHWLKGKNELCDYLVEVTEKEAKAHHKEKTWSRPIWDVTAVAWLLDAKFMDERIIKSPIPEYDNTYSFNENRHDIKYVYYIYRDRLFEDLFKKLSS